MPRNGISISWLRKLSYLKKLMRNLPYLESIFRCLHLLHSKQYHNSTPNTVNLVAIQNLTNYKIYNLEYCSCEIKKKWTYFQIKVFCWKLITTPQTMMNFCFYFSKFKTIQRFTKKIPQFLGALCNNQDA